jgi:hypothetical protein
MKSRPHALVHNHPFKLLASTPKSVTGSHRKNVISAKMLSGMVQKISLAAQQALSKNASKSLLQI